RQVLVVQLQDASLALPSRAPETTPSVLGLSCRDGDARAVDPVVPNRVGEECAPATTDVEQALAGSERELAADSIAASCSRLLQAVGGRVEVAAGEGHALAEKRAKEVAPLFVVQLSDGFGLEMAG